MTWQNVISRLTYKKGYRFDEAGMIQYIRHTIHNTEIHESDEWMALCCLIPTLEENCNG